MKLYNRGRRTINNNTPQAHPPGKWLGVDEVEGKKLLRLFPRDLTTNEAAEAAEAAAKAEKAKLEAENAMLRAKLAEYEAQLGNLEKVATSPESDLLSQTMQVPSVLQPVVAAAKKARGGK